MTYQEMIDTVAGLAAADNIPRGEVLDADTITLITQLGASLSQRAVELAEENRALVANRDLLRREINERNQLITGLRAQIAGSAGSAELVGQAWSALGEAGIGQGPDLTLADAIRTLADTPLDALPAPDVTNADHNAFVSDWFGELTDEQLGRRDDPSTFEVRPGEHLGDVVREQVLTLIDRIDAAKKVADQMRDSRIDAAAKAMSDAADRGCVSLSWDSLPEEIRDQWRGHARALDDADLLA